jgi:hypothetical protein
MILDITKLQTVTNWAKDIGIEKKGKPFSAQYAHQLFQEDNQSPFAQEVKTRFVLVVIDGFKFVIGKQDIPISKRKKLNNV